VVASDKLFYWLFQNQPDRILPLLPDLPADARGYRFSAPVLKERPELPALILEGQMAADGGFLRRLYAETARLVQQEPTISQWRVVVGHPIADLLAMPGVEDLDLPLPHHLEVAQAADL
jgi:hypothetical protein